MQFEYDTTVFSATRVSVEGKIYVSVFVGDQPDPDKVDDCHGFSVRKIPADPAVFEQLNDIKYGQPQRKKLVMRLKQGAGGKSQPHVLGVVPDKPQSQAQKS